ncbi:hypothetical protein RIF29_05288 [Crotalaria pallida]|uniref:Uncharacterized protein n=1 Tax=Crotalaria pallida TaxID=3830 RepID=A0AAN9PA91_CROPI
MLVCNPNAVRESKDWELSLNAWLLVSTSQLVALLIYRDRDVAKDALVHKMRCGDQKLGANCNQHGEDHQDLPNAISLSFFPPSWRTRLFPRWEVPNACPGKSSGSQREASAFAACKRPSKRVRSVF